MKSMVTDGIAVLQNSVCCIHTNQLCGQTGVELEEVQAICELNIWTFLLVVFVGHV